MIFSIPLCIYKKSGRRIKDFENSTYVQERINRFKRFIGTDPLQLTDTERFELAETLKDMLNSPLY